MGIGTDRSPTEGRLGLQTWGRLAVAIDPAPAGSTGSVVTVRLDGTLVAQVPARDLLVSAITSVQIGNDTKNQPFGLFVDDVAVSR